jgi:hypothetical protein
VSIPSPAAPPPPVKPDGFTRWHRRIIGICLAVFAFDLGVFLLFFPWSRLWGQNWIPVHSPHFATLWMSHYFRGFVSGIGLLNLYIAITEFGRQIRSFFPKTQ